MADFDPHWYKDAIIYELHVKAFFDSTNNGIGDFRGLTQKLDYLEELGVTALWLLPFYPSPLRDDGYDIADYNDVNPLFGKLGEFRNFVREAHRRGMRVITEVVINHTSDQHKWFQRARRAKPGSAWRDFYVWSDTDRKYTETRIIFTDTETSNWTWDPVAKAYYWHRFFSHQPDLNFDNPQVFKAVTRSMKFWLDMGVDGLRLDAIPYLVERDGTNNENLPETHAVIRRLREWLDAHYPDRMFLAEANQWPEDVRPYFGDGDECHMAFHFPVMPRIYMALAQEDRHPVTDILRQTPEIPESCQWGIFLRNHDELTLEMVSDRERDYLWSTYAHDKRARLNLGIRRRLAPLLENDRNKVQLLNSLLMSLPGTPIVYYGDEIGMGDNIFLGDRDGVRTPMQWSPDRNGGFSRADPAQLYLPPIMDPVYGFEAVNVEAQARNPSSQLNWMRRLIGVRKAHKAFGRGTINVLYPGNRKVLAYLREFDGEVILCVANLSRSAQPVELNLAAYKGRVPIELLGRSAFPPVGDLPYFITLPSYGFYWFLLAEEAEAPMWHADVGPSVPDLLTLVAPDGWNSLFDETPARGVFEQRILPDFLANQRWFAGQGRKIESVRIARHARLQGAKGSWRLAFVEVGLAGGEIRQYCLPLAIAWETATYDPLLSLLAHTLCRIRRGGRVGVLYDATGDPDFARTLAVKMREAAVSGEDGECRLAFSRSDAFPDDVDLTDIETQRLGKEQTNTSVILGSSIIVKMYRRLDAGIHPEVEVGRFLTERAGSVSTPAFFGALDAIDSAGHSTTLAMAQAYVWNQGDGWNFALEHLERVFDEVLLLPAEERESAAADRLRGFVGQIGRLGQRTAEVHLAFAGKGLRAFAPTRTRREDIQRWSRTVKRQAAAALQRLRKVRKGLPVSLREDADRLLNQRAAVMTAVETVVPETLKTIKTRCHGDYHLGQVVVARDDFVVIDFEGESGRPLKERRAKHPPLRDVAGMLWSIYAVAWEVLFRYAAEKPGTLESLKPLVEAWERAATDTFIEGYEQALVDNPAVLENPETRNRLLALFLFEKVFSDIEREAAERPDRLPMALAAFERLMKGETW